MSMLATSVISTDIGGGGGGGGGANLNYISDVADGTVTSDSGTNATIPGGSAGVASLMLPADKTKLDGIATAATANNTNAFLLARANHTGTQATSTILSGTFADALIAASNVTQHVGAIDHNSTLNYVLAQHRIINDAGSLTTELFSADKILALTAAASAGGERKGNVATDTKGSGNITLSGEQTLNGVTTSTDRILVVEQSSGDENGIYVTAAGAWTRATDADTSAEVNNGMTTYIENASATHFQSTFILVTADPITLDTTLLSFDELPPPNAFGTTAGTATEGNDARVPTQDENDALVGTGTPSSGNVFVTDDDARMIDNRDPIVSNVNTYTAQQAFGTTTLADGANIAWALNANQVSKVTLAGNRTLDNPTEMIDGGVYILRVIQDPTGSRTLAYGSAYLFPGVVAPILSTDPDAIDIVTFVSDGSNMYGVIQKSFG